MDELNLDQFKELIGDLEPSKSTSFRLDDIMKEVAEAQEALDRTSAQPEEHSEEPTEILSVPEPEEEPVVEVQEDEEPEPSEETAEEETVIQTEEPESEEETEADETPEPEPERPRKKHFWDNWVVPEEDEESSEELPQDETAEEDEEPERIGFFASLFEGAVEETEIPEEDGEDVFQEKQPKRRFWERWLTPEKLEEEESLNEKAAPVTAAEETIAIPLDEPQEEPTQVLESQPTVVFEPVPEKSDETETSEEPVDGDRLYESIAQAAEAAKPEQEFDAQPIADLMDEMTEEETIGPEEELDESIPEPEEQTEAVPVEEDAVMEEPTEPEEQIEAVPVEEDAVTEEPTEPEEQIEAVPVEEDAVMEEPTEPEEQIEAVPVEEDVAMEEPTESVPEPETPEVEEEPAIRLKKPKFLNKWFAPIGELTEEPQKPEEEPEETTVIPTELQEEPVEEAEADLEALLKAVPEEPSETEESDMEESGVEESESAEPVAETVPTEPEQTISQEEFEAFLREADEEPQPRASFAELMRESGVDWHESAPQTEAPVVSEDLTSQVVYLELGAKEPASEPTEEEIPEIPSDLEAVSEKPFVKPADTYEEAEKQPKKPKGNVRPEPAWLHMSLERIGDIAPQIERVNGEPVLMGEIRRLEREKEQRNQTRTKQAAQPATTVPPMPRPVYPAKSETEDDGGDDEVSGGQRPTEFELTAQSPEEDLLVTNEVTNEEGPEDIPEQDIEEEEADGLPEEEEAPSKAERQKKSRFARWRERRKKAQEARTRVPKSAKAGFKQWNRVARSIGRRSLAVGLLTLIALYLSCSATMNLPVPEMLSYTASTQNFYIAFIVLTVVAMLVAWDVLLDGIKALLHLQADFCTLIILTLVLTIVHSAVRITVTGEELSYPCVAMAALFALMRARVAQASARRNTYKTAALNHAPIGIYLHREPKPHLLKRRLDDNETFVACAARDGWNSRFERLYTPLAIIAAAVMAWVISTMTGDHGRFVYAFSALLVAASQIGLLTAVALGSSGATQRLMRDDAALAGLSAAVRMANVSQVVMTEEDLFPAGSILIDDYVDIRGSMALDDVLAYAAAVENNSAVGRVLKEKIHQRYGDQVAAHDHVRYKNGGNGARIGDREVLFGTAAFMEDMKVPIPALADPDEHLFLAVDGMTEAVFEIEYVATTQVYTALQSLAERRISVLFQAGDCYLSEERLSDLFGLQPGMIRMPDLEQARQIGTPEYVEHDILLAILTRDGAAPYSDCVDAAYSLSRLSAGGMLLGTLAAVLDLALMSYLCFVFAPLGASPLRVLLYSLLWFIPIFFIENETKRG